MVARGKGIFLHKVPSVLNGDPAAIGDALTLAGFQRLDVKVAEGPRPYRNYYPFAAWGYNVKPDWMRVLREHFAGEVWGWGFDYGFDYKGEGRVLGEQVRLLGLDGGIFDVEGRFERQPNASMRGVDMVAEYKKQTNKPVGWCSWALFKSSRGGTWHNAEVAKRAMLLCDFGMPMTYWWGRQPSNAVWWLNASVVQWKSLITDKPIIPVGRAYIGDGGEATMAGIAAFGLEARNRGLQGESWWHLYSAIRRQDWWSALSALPFYPT